MAVNHHGRSAIWAGAELATHRNGQLELCGEPEAQANGIYLDPPFGSRQRAPVAIEASNSD
jgi:16S rRNA G966 N2-methylase RsmD